MIPRPLIAVAIASTLAAPAFAAAGPLVVTSKVLVERRTAAPDGTTRVALAKPTRVVPGDRVVFVLDYRNTGRQPIADIVLANPLPPAIAYRAPRAGSPAPELSVDGRTFGPLASLMVPMPGGGARPARTDDVVAVRWRLSTPLAAGGQGELAFQAALK